MRKSIEITKLCSCIKKVRSKTIKVRNRREAESRAIGICVKSVLHSRGKTIRKFKCKPSPKGIVVEK